MSICLIQAPTNKNINAMAVYISKLPFQFNMIVDQRRLKDSYGKVKPIPQSNEDKYITALQVMLPTPVFSSMPLYLNACYTCYPCVRRLSMLYLSN